MRLASAGSRRLIIFPSGDLSPLLDETVYRFNVMGMWHNSYQRRFKAGLVYLCSHTPLLRLLHGLPLVLLTDHRFLSNRVRRVFLRN